jgi:phosphatidylinositol glycan class O
MVDKMVGETTRHHVRPLSPLLVILNTFGPTTLIALATSLLGIWNVAPLDATYPHRATQSDASYAPQQPKSQAHVATLSAVRAALGISQYFAAWLLGSALSAAVLRRHLMVWKVFAPSFMLGAVELICVDAAVLVGLWLGVGRIVSRITRVFALPPAAAAPRKASPSSK